MRNLAHAEALHAKAVALAEKVLQRPSRPNLDYEVAMEIASSGGALDEVATGYETEEDELVGEAAEMTVHEYVVYLYGGARDTAAEQLRKLRALDRVTR